MRRMQEDMDRLFNIFFGGQGGQAGAPAQSGTGQAQAALQWAPSVDISETDREWRIEAELPGVSRDDIDLQVQQGYLILSAETRQEEETPAPGGGRQAGQIGQGAQSRQYHRRERRYGYFQRVIPLPENVSEDQITCEFRNGVLAVHVPKTEPARPQARRIPIQEVDRLPSETASGRLRTEAEIEMTEDEDAAAEDHRAMAGAKGGRASSSGRSAPAAQAAGNASGGEGGAAASGSRGGAQSSRSKKTGA